MAAVLDAASGSLVERSAFGALQALSALLLVGAIALVIRRLLKRGPKAIRSAHIHVEERLAVDLRQALLIVRVEQRRFLLATAEQSPARLIAELTGVSETSPSGPSLPREGELP